MADQKETFAVDLGHLKSRARKTPAHRPSRRPIVLERNMGSFRARLRNAVAGSRVHGPVRSMRRSCLTSPRRLRARRAVVACNKE